jgi:hypothetical protein
VASNGSFAYLFDMGAKKEFIQFHTSVLCEGDVKFLFAKDNKTINGDYYVVTFHRSSIFTVENCSNSEHMPTNSNCSELYKSKVKLCKFKCLKCSHIV